MLALTLAGAATQLSTGSPDRGADVQVRRGDPDGRRAPACEGRTGHDRGLGVLPAASRARAAQRADAALRSLPQGRVRRPGSPRAPAPGLGQRRLPGARSRARRAHSTIESAANSLLVGVSYSGFGVATLASHHPELRPDRLIVIDSYLDLAARRAAAGTGAIGREIDAETGGSNAALEERSVRVDGLAALRRHRDTSAGDLEHRARRGTGVQGGNVQPGCQRRRPAATLERPRRARSGMGHDEQAWARPLGSRPPDPARRTAGQEGDLPSGWIRPPMGGM